MPVRLFAMTCGWLTGSTRNFLAGERGRLRVPVPCFLIDHPKGKVLFDSGLHPDAGSDPAGRLGLASQVSKATGIVIRATQTAPRALDKATRIADESACATSPVPVPRLAGQAPDAGDYATK